MTLDTTGDIYIADTLNNRIRKITMITGVITTVAGNGNQGYSGDNVSATSTSIFFPNDVAVDPSGNMFIADTDDCRIRRVSAATGMITTIAGKGNDWLFQSRGRSASGSATEYYLYSPTGVTLDTSGNVYIADDRRDAIFKITLSSGSISTVAGTMAGTSSWGYNGDDILATAAALSFPEKVAFDVSGNIYISDSANRRIRKVTASTGMISAVAGIGAFPSSELSADIPYNGEGGLATSAIMNYPTGVAIDVAGNLYFADANFNVVRKVTFTGATPSVSVTSAPSVKGAPSAPPSAPLASTPTQFISTTPTVRPSTSVSMAPTPGASSSPSSSSPTSSPTSSKASVAPTFTATQSSSTTHFAQTLHLTIIFLSSLLLLHLCRDA